MTITEPNAPLFGLHGDDMEGVFEQGEIPGPRERLGQSSGEPSASDPSGALRALLEMPLETTEFEQHDGGEAGARPAGAAPAPLPRPIPVPPPIRLRARSGRYRSPAINFQLELRVDIDGRRPLRRLSGDYYSISGARSTYFGSWTVDAVTIQNTPTATIVTGTARTTWATSFTVARVSIPRSAFPLPPPAATITWFTPSGAKGATYVCARQSSAFRTVELEQDCESGVTPFASYNTGSLPSGGPARTLSVGGAYAEAGVQVLDTGGGNVISQPSGFQWDNASLHDAMEAHFSRFADAPQFKVWLLHARAHVMGSGLLGIMFDQENPQRQGCASFYQSISSGTPADQRTQLYVNVHELGHCFNLFHSFHKSFMSPPLPNRPGSLSWMNYPQNYNPGGGAPGGAAAFWAAFPFEFDDLELAHLRHGFRNDVIMGGNPFGTGAALTGPEADAPTGYTLSIAPYPPRAPLGTPVVVEIMLAAERGRPVHSREQLHPKYGFLEIAVERPGGQVVIHRPPVHSCAMPEIHIADAGEQLPISAYIGYDAVHGHLFADVGTYRLRATYTAPDGVPVASEICTLRVAAPRNDEDEDVADLMLRSQTGMVMTLLGSDSDYLSAGTEAIETILERHGEHPTAVYARLAAGMSAARSFLRVRPDGTTQLRQPDPARADRLLGAAVDASRGSAGLDNLTVYQALDQLARSHQSGGDADRARSVRQDAISLARANEAPAAVVHDLEG